MRASFRTLALGSLFLSGALVAQAAPAGSGMTIADTLADQDRFVSSENADGLDRFRFDQRNWYDYDILFAAVLLDASLVPAVTSADTEATLLAPNDRAFQLLAYDLTGQWFFTEQGVLNALVGLSSAGAVDLGNVLTYHVIPGRVERADLPFNTAVPTLNGETLRFRLRFFGFFIQIRDNDNNFKNPYLIRTNLDAGNSVVHSISRVLIPANVGG